LKQRAPHYQTFAEAMPAFLPLKLITDYTAVYTAYPHYIIIAHFKCFRFPSAMIREAAMTTCKVRMW